MKEKLIDKIGLIIQSNNTADAANAIVNIMVEVAVLARYRRPTLDGSLESPIDIIEQAIDKKS